MILGASGLLGKALTHEWTGDEVAGFGSRQVDIRDAHKVMEAVKKSIPSGLCSPQLTRTWTIARVIRIWRLQ